MLGTWQDEEYSRDEGQDGALRPDVSDVADDECREDEEEGDTVVLTSAELDLWEELLKWKLHGEKTAQEEERGFNKALRE